MPLNISGSTRSRSGIPSAFASTPMLSGTRRTFRPAWAAHEHCGCAGIFGGGVDRFARSQIEKVAVVPLNPMESTTFSRTRLEKQSDAAEFTLFLTQPIRCGLLAIPERLLPCPVGPCYSAAPSNRASLPEAHQNRPKLNHARKAKSPKIGIRPVYFDDRVNPGWLVSRAKWGRLIDLPGSGFWIDGPNQDTVLRPLVHLLSKPREVLGSGTCNSSPHRSR